MLPPSLLPGYLSIKSSQICGNIIKYVQEDVMPFEECLHALIFSSDTAALPLPQRRTVQEQQQDFYTSPSKKPYANDFFKNLQSRMETRLHTPSQKTQEVSSKVSVPGI